MRRLHLRVDEALYRRISSRAAAEGRSREALIRTLLERATMPGDARARVRTRLEALGLARSYPPSRRAPSRSYAIALTRGAGRIASDALVAERRTR